MAARKGEVRAWLLAYAADPPDTDDCIEWPFSCAKDGYPKARNPRTGHADIASRVIWEFMHDGKPFPENLNASHQCHRGQLACVNHRPVVPETTQINMQRNVDRGAQPWGAAHPNAKLTEAQVLSIKERLASGASLSSLAREYGVSDVHIHLIKTGKRWARLRRPEGAG